MSPRIEEPYIRSSVYSFFVQQMFIGVFYVQVLGHGLSVCKVYIIGYAFLRTPHAGWKENPSI